MKPIKENFYSKDEALNLLNKIDSWIGNCDTKFSMLLALLGIFFGLTINVFSAFTELRDIISIWNKTIKLDKILSIACCVLVFAYIILIILCSTFSIIGINAKIKNTKENPLFFGNIAQYKNLNELEKNLLDLTEKEYISLLNEQIFTNSKICTKKYRYYKKALFCLFPSIIIAILCLVILAI